LAENYNSLVSKYLTEEIGLTITEFKSESKPSDDGYVKLDDKIFADINSAFSNVLFWTNEIHGKGGRHRFRNDAPQRPHDGGASGRRRHAHDRAASDAACRHADRREPHALLPHAHDGDVREDAA